MYYLYCITIKVEYGRVEDFIFTTAIRWVAGG